MADESPYSLEPPKPEPLEELAALYGAYAHAVCGRPLEDVDDLAERISAPGLDLSEDARACYADGDLVAWVQVSGSAPYTQLDLWGAVHPGHAGRGIGTRLVQWALERADQLSRRVPAGKRVVLRSELVGADPRAVPLFEGLGFRVVRHYQELILRLVGPPASPAFPVGISVRTYRRGDDLRAICWANRQAFRDHWGYVERPFEDSLARFQAMVQAPDFRPEDWFIAYDGDKVVGMALCRNSMPEDPHMAWVDSLCVRRHWRRRGIGLALLQHAIHAFYVRGKTSIALGVDTQSLTGATRLYEKAGMEPYQVFHVVESVIRPGASSETTS